MRAARLPLLERLLTVRPACLAAALFGVGVIVGANADVLARVWGIAALACGGLTLFAALLRRPQRTALLLAALLFLGAWRASAALEARPAIERQYDVAVEGVIASDPQYDDVKGRLICRLRGVSIEGAPLGTDVRLYLHGESRGLKAIRYGQRIHLQGHLFSADPATNPGEFDFGRYLWRQNLGGYVTGDLENAALTEARWSPIGGFYAFRRAVAKRIDRLFPDNAVLVRALVLGDRSDMDEDLRDSFAKAGAAHLLAISGLHVTLLASALALLLGRLLPRKITFLVTSAALLFYGALAGFSASIVRAILMFFVLGAAPLAGRQSDAFTRAALAFGLMLAVRPLYIFDTGFVLSFSAVAGLLCLAPLLERAGYPLLMRLQPRGRKLLPRLRYALARAVLASFAATLAAELGTLPWVVASYGTLPLLGFLTNLVAVPLTMLGLALALAALVLSVFSLLLAALLAHVPELAFTLLVRATALGAKLPFSEFRLSRFPAGVTVLYVVFLVAASELTRFKPGKRALFAAALPVLAALAIGLHALAGYGCSVLFLDAGQADCALITAQGRHYMFDVGGWDSPAADYLEHEGIRLDGVFLSHPHSDHAGGLSAILRNEPPKVIYLPEGWFEVEGDPGIFETLEIAQDMGVELYEVCAGDTLRLSPEVEAEVFHPAADFHTDSPNSLSMVLCVRYGTGSVLFTGDLPSADEPPNLPDVDVLKVAHHGAANGSSIWQIAATTPSVAIIQVGRRNSYGHPNPATVERLQEAGARVLRTDQNGAVRMRILKDGRVIARPMFPDGLPTSSPAEAQYELE